MSWCSLNQNCQICAFPRLKRPQLWVSIQELPKFDLSLTKFATKDTISQTKIAKKYTLGQTKVRRSMPLWAAHYQVPLLWKSPPSTLIIQSKFKECEEINVFL